MMLELTKAERDELAKFKRDNRKLNYSVDLLQVNAGKSIVTKFFARHGYKDIEILECDLYQFKHVGMHTDTLHTRKYVAIIFPVMGKGELSSFRKTKNEKSIIHSSFNKRYALYLDDTEPHCFIANSMCLAIIASVPRKIADEVFTKN